MKYKKPYFIINKDLEKESTGEDSIPDKSNKMILFSYKKGAFSDNSFSYKNIDFPIKIDELSESHDSFSNDDYNFVFDHSEIFSFIKNNEINEMNRCFDNYNYLNENTFKKNRNNLNNNLLKDKENSNDAIDINLTSNKSNRCDSLLIKFKAALGKWFINTINEKLKLLKKNSILKRRIKFYSFNYKKFTLIVSYTHNKKWLKYKMKDLILIGDEENQKKNKKAINSLNKKNLIELNEIKDMLESSYEDMIKGFYLSEEFNKFKEDKRVKELDINFGKIMGINLLEEFEFISFFEKRKGNIHKVSAFKNSA